MKFLCEYRLGVYSQLSIQIYTLYRNKENKNPQKKISEISQNFVNFRYRVDRLAFLVLAFKNYFFYLSPNFLE